MTRLVPLLLPLVLAAPLALGGCGTNLECGGNSTKKVAADGTAICVEPNLKANACDLDAGARVVGGECVGDPTQFPSCGSGTKFEKSSNSCVPDVMGDGGAGGCVAPTCGPNDKDATHFCVSGTVHYLKDESCTGLKTFVAKLYLFPTNLLADPMTPPDDFTMTDSNGGYKFAMAKANNGKIFAIGVIDPDGMGPHSYILTGSGAQNVVGGNIYKLDLYATESAMVASWDTQAGLMGMDTFEMVGAYVARFYSSDGKTLIPGVTLSVGTTGVDNFYFKGNVSTIDKTAVATDAAAGSMVRRFTGIDSFSGKGGGLMWPSVLGGSTKTIVFVQKFLAM